MHISDQPLNRPSGKTLVFFMGAGFCPFCASERWAVVRALSNFGSWQGLAESASAGQDENTSTFQLSILRMQNTQAII